MLKKACLIGIALLLCYSNAYANSGPPPSAVWLTFEYDIAPRPDLDGVQLIGCDTLDCEQPELLQQWGACDTLTCLASPPKLTDTFECADNRCRAASYSYESAYFKLIVQFSDRTRMSQVVKGLPYDWPRETAWRIVVQSTDLLLVQDTNVTETDDKFLAGLVLTQFTELLVAGLYLKKWAKSDPAPLHSRLIMIFLINLATYPVVWLSFPALGRFQTGDAKGFGIFILMVAFVYAILLISIYLEDNKIDRRSMIALTIMAAPLTCPCYIFIIFAFSADYSVPAAGLSPNAIILTSEVFAVTCEAVLIFILSRRALSVRQAGMSSLLMNAASFLLGLLVFGTWF